MTDRPDKASRRRVATAIGALTAAQPALLDHLGGRYDLVTKVGEGGMAEVFLGWMHSVGGIRRKVAIKRILPDLAQRKQELFEDMFEDEARLAFLLEHDNIVRVYDVGQSASTFFIVMEYVEGMDLRRLFTTLQEQKVAMPLPEAAYVAACVASGLAYAHAHVDPEGKPLSVVHNDISPPNILVGRNGDVKIADFGLSDAHSNAVQTPDGMVKGKFAYLSPEATKDPTTVSQRSDIFSLGIVLWELIAGQRLFLKEDDRSTLLAVRACEVPDLRTLRRGIPRRLIEVVNRMLEADPADRYQTSLEVFNDLVEVQQLLRPAASRVTVGDFIARLKGDIEGAFEGEELGDEKAAAIMGELDGMLPPGVAEHLLSFVTGVTYEDEASPDESQPGFNLSDSWVGSLYEEIGLDGEGKLFNDPNRKTGFIRLGSRTGSMRPVGSQSSEGRAVARRTEALRAVARRTGAIRAVERRITSELARQPKLAKSKARSGRGKAASKNLKAVAVPDAEATPAAETPQTPVAYTVLHLVATGMLALAAGIAIGAFLMLP